MVHSGRTHAAGDETHVCFGVRVGVWYSAWQWWIHSWTYSICVFPTSGIHLYAPVAARRAAMCVSDKIAVFTAHSSPVQSTSDAVSL